VSHFYFSSLSSRSHPMQRFLPPFFCLSLILSVIFFFFCLSFFLGIPLFPPGVCIDLQCSTFPPENGLYSDSVSCLFLVAIVSIRLIRALLGQLVTRMIWNFGIFLFMRLFLRERSRDSPSSFLFFRACCSTECGWSL